MALPFACCNLGIQTVPMNGQIFTVLRGLSKNVRGHHFRSTLKVEPRGVCLVKPGLFNEVGVTFLSFGSAKCRGLPSTSTK